jgi:transposase InsO family protein
LRKRLQAAGTQVWIDPSGHMAPIPPETLRNWIYRYRLGGIDGLCDKIRHDKGSSQVPDPLAKELTDLRSLHPDLTTQRLLLLLQESKSWDGKSPSRSALYRLAKAQGLQRRHSTSILPTDSKAFAYEHFGQMWVADFLHGPTVRAGKKTQKLYLLAIIDDATRFVIHAQFYITEGLEALVYGLSEAVHRFGIPQRFYTDNGSAFRSRHLQVIAARLGFALPHTPAYRPQGRGKIERFFRTMREQFLQGTTATTRKDWNQRLGLWIDKYHRSQHDGIKATPLDFRLATESVMRSFPGVADPLKKTFLLEATRKVRRDGTINLDGKVWDIPGALPGEEVEILHAPWVPDRILVGPDHKEAFALDRTGNAHRFQKSPLRGRDEPLDPSNQANHNTKDSAP